jgi:hypothetical protein
VAQLAPVYPNRRKRRIIAESKRIILQSEDIFAWNRVVFMRSEDIMAGRRVL